MLKLKLLFRRVKAYNFKRMMVYVNDVKKETKLPRIFIILDMLYCILAYNVGFYDYHMFGFIHIHGRKNRKTFFTMNDNWHLSKLVNTPEDAKYFIQKDLFCEAFAKYLGREVLDIRGVKLSEFKGFLERHNIVFAKVVDSFGGLGVQRYDCSEMDLSNKEVLKTFHKELMDAHQYLMEEALLQHPDMNKLYPHSINTIRVVTVTDSLGVPHVMYTFIRCGIHGAFVDNTTSGGLCAMVNAEGMITKPAFSDKTGGFYDVHPDTQTPFAGFVVPYYKEALEMCKEACAVKPGMRYIGWDVCVTPDGPVLVESNYLPAYDGQIYHQMDHPGQGLKPLFKEIVPEL